MPVTILHGHGGALVDGKIGDHDGIMAMLSPEPCPWIGVRIVDDTADIADDDSALPTQVERP